MAEPPRDDGGWVKAHDDPDILEDDGLLRWINPNFHLVEDKNAGCLRLSSNAFKETQKAQNPQQGMSVSLERALLAVGEKHGDRLPASDWGIVRLITGEMRSLEFKVGSDPRADNPFHASVWGIERGMRKGAIKKQVVAHAAWVIKARGVA